MARKKEEKASNAENQAKEEKPKAAAPSAGAGDGAAKVDSANAGAANANAVVKQGDNIKVEYTGSFEDGKVFDSSEKHKQPLSFEAGTGKVIPGFDKAVIGMKLGEEKDVKIQPEDAYGMPRPELVQKIPRKQLPQDQEPQKGMMLLIGLPNGHQVPAKITEVSGEDVTIDINHPLAGKVLNFKLKVVGIN